MIETDLKVADKTKLQHLIDDTVNGQLYYLLKAEHEKSLSGT